MVERLREGTGAAISPPALRDLVSTVDTVRRQRDQLRRLVERVPAVLYIDALNEPGMREYPTLYISPQIEELLGITAEEWSSNDDLWERHMHPEDWPATSTQYDEFLATREGTLVQEYRVIRPDTGATVWIRDECSISNEPGTGRPVVLGVMFDISSQKDLEEQLRAAEAKNRALIEQIPHVVWIEPVRGQPEPPYVSAGVESVIGVPRSEWLRPGWWVSHLHEDDRADVLAFRAAVERGPGPAQIEYRLVLENRGEMWVSQTASLVMNGDEPWAVQSLLEDITSRKVAEEELEFRATHDPLTGLANRTLFAESIELALARAARHNQSVALLYCDLDDFKIVNDTHGHEVGDLILQEVARRMMTCVRESDLVARPGGDEFLVLLPDIDPAPGEAVGRGHRAERLADGIAARIRRSLETAVETARGPIWVSMSIGRCSFPWDATDSRSLLTAADEAMYRAKG